MAHPAIFGLLVVTTLVFVHADVPTVGLGWTLYTPPTTIGPAPKEVIPGKETFEL